MNDTAEASGIGRVDPMTDMRQLDVGAIPEESRCSQRIPIRQRSAERWLALQEQRWRGDLAQAGILIVPHLRAIFHDQREDVRVKCANRRRPGSRRRAVQLRSARRQHCQQIIGRALFARQIAQRQKARVFGPLAQSLVAERGERRWR